MKKIRDQKVKITDQTDVPAVSFCAAALNQRRKACAAALPKESEAPFSCAAAEYQRRSFAPRRCQGIQRVYFSAPQRKESAPRRWSGNLLRILVFIFLFRLTFDTFVPTI